MTKNVKTFIFFIFRYLTTGLAPNSTFFSVLKQKSKEKINFVEAATLNIN